MQWKSLVDTKELAGLLVLGPSLGVLLQIRIDVRCVESPAISISLDPTDFLLGLVIVLLLLQQPKSFLVLLLFRDMVSVSFVPVWILVRWSCAS